jgi:zinc-ribbon domain
MDIGSIFLILALLIPVVLFIARPLIERKATSVSPEEQDLSTLLAERDRVVTTLQELDLDFNLGKIPAEDYPTQRVALLQHGADILRQLDTYQPISQAVTAEDRLEAAIAARRLSLEGSPAAARKNGNGVPPVPDDDLEQQIASRRRTRIEKAGGFCPKCGRPIQVSDHFCPKCGASLV